MKEELNGKDILFLFHTLSSNVTVEIESLWNISDTGVP